MIQNKKDWRADLSHSHNLYDYDPSQLLIAYRHMYLDTAKSIDGEGVDEEIAVEALQTVLLLQEAIELQLTEESIQAEPPFFLSQK